jgi:hypothetical protein
MTIVCYQPIVIRIKELLNPKNDPPKTVAELRAEGEDIAEFLAQFPWDYKVFQIGEALIVKSLLPGERNAHRWIWCTVSETPHWKPLIY